MNFFKFSSFLASKASVQLDSYLYSVYKILIARAPKGENGYSLFHSNGLPVISKNLGDHPEINDQSIVRMEDGDTYADTIQDDLTSATEEISRNELAIRESDEELREIAEKRQSVLVETPDYYMVQIKTVFYLLGLLVVGMSDIGPLFSLYADILGVDTMKLSTEASRHTSQFVIAVVVSVGTFLVTAAVGHYALYARFRVVWVFALSCISITTAYLRMLQSDATHKLSLEQLPFAVLFAIIGIAFPLMAAYLWKELSEAFTYVRKNKSVLRRLSDIEEICQKKRQSAARLRRQAVNRRDSLVELYRRPFQQKQRERDRNISQWQIYLRRVEAKLNEHRLAYLIWQGLNRRTTGNRNPLLRPLFIGSTILFLIFFLLFGFGYASASSFNLIAVCDRSTSADEYSCNEKNLSDAADYWRQKADDADGGGIFEVVLIDSNLQTSIILFTEKYPDRFPGPVSANKRKWRTEFCARIEMLTKNLPTRKGSAISAAIFRASLRMPADGETLLLLLTDLREVDLKKFDFEWQPPTPKEFLKWLEANAIKPKFPRNTSVIVCGVHPYKPSKDTSPVTTDNYAKTINVWNAVFEKWGLKATITEACSFGK
ncbi:hypothetical protein [Candidatus Magnetominusculus dajiuhuensis]|uniref:hypothetical protein n=1 Tax=Candidatus Magnetominusculus dajiuhuensis TaxID=3137712 RepID=UPI003B42F825